MTEHANRFAHLRGAAFTDIGRKRKNNEDAFGAFPSQGIWCVADGMGGGDDGEVASAAVVKSVDAYLSDLPVADSGAYAGSQIAAGVVRAIEEASGWIFRRTRSKNLKGCGSTFVGVVFDATVPNTALVLHVGDSRLYRLRGKELKQITKDHSVAEMMGAKDEKELNPMFRGMILRAVGIESSVEVDKTPMSVNEGDVILICSDGLTRMVPDKRIGEIIRAGGDDVEATAKRLIAEANEAGGVDNVTVELVKVGALPPPQPAVSIQQSEDSVPSSSTFRTLDREYGPPKRRRISRSMLIGIAVSIAAAAFGWAISLSFTREKPHARFAPSVEAMPSGETASAQTNAPERSSAELADVPAPQTQAAEQPKAAESNDVACLPSIPTPAPTGSVAVVAETKEDLERNAIEEELRLERERRKQADEAAARAEGERRQVAQELAATYDRSFVDFACFVNDAFGKGASDRAYSLCRQLHVRSNDADVSMYATDFAAEVRQLAARVVGKYGDKGQRQESAAGALMAVCRELAGMDPATPAAQRKCLELMELVAERRKRSDGRK